MVFTGMIPKNLFLCMCFFAVASQETRTGTDVETLIEALLARMNLREKLGQLTQYDGHATGEYRELHMDLARQGLLGSTLNVRGAKRVNELQTVALNTSLKIPVLFAFDVIHGYRTLFPIPLGMTASWDLEAVQRAAAIAAAESRSVGIHWTFAPMIDIARDPRWGRVMEGSGEDVFLTSEMTKAHVRGFQGIDYSRNDKVVACAKHFVGYGGAEGGRDYNTVDISEHRLRETYFPPFKAAIDAGVGTFMTGFNELRGVPVTANQYLLREILRSEWKFDGPVISDYNAVTELISHGHAADAENAARHALNAGTDMEMFSTSYVTYGKNLTDSGKVAMETIDNAVRNVLRIKFRLGLFENPMANETLERETVMKPEFTAAAREIAAKTFVLLKNDGQTLPIDTNAVKSIAVIGELANDKFNAIDHWAGDALFHQEDFVTVLEGLQQRLNGTGVSLNYSKGCASKCESDVNFPSAVAAASATDFTVLVVGETKEVSGEGGSLANIDLSGRQLDLVKAIHATGKPYVVVLTNGRPLVIPWLAENSPAILVTWKSGTMGGLAIADVLLGDVNPSGKLPMSFPRSVGQIPVYYDHKNTGRPDNTADPGNRYYAKYLDMPPTPLYEFGFGLSYTTFSIDNLRLSAGSIKHHENITVTVDVQNTGDRIGDEVVQLYIRDMVASITRPVRQLKAFRKIRLAPGQKMEVAFVLQPADLSFLNSEMQMVVEAGLFKVFVGSSSKANMSGEFAVTSSTPLTPTTSAPAETTSQFSASDSNHLSTAAMLFVYFIICFISY